MSNYEYAFVRGAQFAIDHKGQPGIAETLQHAIQLARLRGWDASHITEFNLGVAVIRDGIAECAERHEPRESGARG